jgi:hypothetical protein
VLRESVAVMVREMMELEVAQLAGAEHGDRAPGRRAAQRNGYSPGSMAEITIRSRSTNLCRLLTSRRSAVRDRHRPLTRNACARAAIYLFRGTPPSV